MRRSSRSERAAIALASALLLGPIAAAGDDGAKTEYPLHFTAFWKNEASYLEAGPGWRKRDKPADGHDTREVTLRVRVPFRDEDKDDKLATVDRDADTWKLVAGFDWERDVTREGSSVSRLYRVGASAEWGTDLYKFSPGGGAEQSRRRDSWGGELGGVVYFKRGVRLFGEDIRLGPQLHVRYAREWEASKETGVVIPGTGGAPETVKNLILDGPQVTTQVSARVGLPVYAPFAEEFAVGPYASYTFGDADDLLPDAWQRLRGELWLYYFPVAKPANVRFGVAGFLDWRANGTDGRDARELGLLVQLRLGAWFIEY
jgi:hypothetical protein